MQRENLLGFVLRNRFKLRDLIDRTTDPIESFRLAKLFPGLEYLDWSLNSDELRQLSIALGLGSHVSNSSTEYFDTFSQLASELNDEQWKFALRFSPYHAVDTKLANLTLIQSAMNDSVLNLHTALAGMDAAIGSSTIKSGAYEIEKSKATTNLFNFVTLYSTYIDICRQIRELVGMKDSVLYDRSIRRLTFKYSGQHGFIKDFRNFQNHFRIVEPYSETTINKTRIANLYLSASELLYSGYKWKAAARTFLENNEKLDVIKMTVAVNQDINRLIRFHHNLAIRRLSREKFAYDNYQHERQRFRHLHSSLIDIGAVFKKPERLMKRLLNEGFVEQVIDSALSEEEMREMLFNMADRHRNLPEHVKEALKLEIRQRIAQKPQFLRGDPYLQGRLHS